MKFQTPSIKLLLPTFQAVRLHHVLSALFVLAALAGSAFLSAKPAVAGVPAHTCDLSTGDPSSYESQCAQGCAEITVTDYTDVGPVTRTYYERVDGVNTRVVTKCIPSAETDYCCTEDHRCGEAKRFNTAEKCEDPPANYAFTYRYTQNCLAFRAGCSARQ